MATQRESGQTKKFVRAILPWLVAIAALSVYLATLNRWISVSGVPYVARITGQLWSPELTGSYGSFGPFGPAFYAVTYPSRFLPEKWMPLSLNLLSAVCAAVTLGLLARSVALLPHDRTHEQRQREHAPFALLSSRAAWIAPVFAAMVCGLQLSFWENATAAADAAFQVMLLAYVIRCLLEYRIDQRDSWLLRAAFVQGIAMTGNWFMIGLLPAFLGSMVWIRGSSFFQLRFLGRLLLCGFAGLLLYLLLPLVNVFFGNGEATFWQALTANAGAQLAVLKMYFLRMPRNLLLLLATTSVLPLLLIGIRWASHFGDPSKLGIAVATAILHLAHSVLLAACIWVSFDPVFSPRQKGINQLELIYLLALSVGYFVGYFLLVFRPILNRMGRAPAWQYVFHRISQGVVWTLLLLVPLGLTSKNLPQIRLTNGRALEQYVSLLAQPLPPQALILCDSDSTRGDFPLKQWLLKSWLARNGRDRNYIFADTMAMANPFYHFYQKKKYGKNWPAAIDRRNPKRVPDPAVLKLVNAIAATLPVYYLNPTFGYYIEAFYQHPHGLALEMKRYPTNSISWPPLMPVEIAENELFWKTNWSAYQHLLPGNNDEQLQGGIRAWWMRKLHIPWEANRTVMMVGKYYAQSLNFWGVRLQVSGRLREAGHAFELALALNPDNVAAKASLESNKQLRAREPMSMPDLPHVVAELGKYRDWQQVLREHGLFDDPTHCLIQAFTFSGGRLLRQAAQQFERVHEFDPDYLPACVWLARFYARFAPEKSLALVANIRAHPGQFQHFGIRNSDVSMAEAMALFASKRMDEADQLLKKTMEENPRDQALLAGVVQVSAMYGRLSNAVTAVDHELQSTPTNRAAMVLKGYLELLNGNYADAIPPLTRVLTLDTNNHTARFNRAIAYLRNNQLDEAERDYHLLEKIFPGSFRIYYGLGEIAWRQNDTNNAIRYYSLYLTNSAPNTEEAKVIGERLQSLNSRSQ